MLTIPWWLSEYGWLFILLIATLVILSLKFLYGFRLVWALLAIQVVNIVIYWLSGVNLWVVIVVHFMVGTLAIVLAAKATMQDKTVCDGQE